MFIQLIDQADDQGMSKSTGCHEVLDDQLLHAAFSVHAFPEVMLSRGQAQVGFLLCVLEHKIWPFAVLELALDHMWVFVRPVFSDLQLLLGCLPDVLGRVAVLVCFQAHRKSCYPFWRHLTSPFLYHPSQS